MTTDIGGRVYNCAPGPHDPILFRELTTEELTHFQWWAELNPAPVGESYWLMHPACREVWEQEVHDGPA